MRDLRGANAILTGGSRGIGPHIARALAREGVNIALAARDEQRLDAVRAEVEQLGVRALSVPTDVRLPEDRARLVDRASSELGPIDLLVNNAGVEPTSEFVRLDPTAIEETISINLTACVLLMRMVLPGMVERHRGHVVNMSSVAGKVAVPYDSVYSATKFALVGITHAVLPLGGNGPCPSCTSGTRRRCSGWPGSCWAITPKRRMPCRTSSSASFGRGIQWRASRMCRPTCSARCGVQPAGVCSAG